MGRPHSNKTPKSDQVGPPLKPISVREKEARKAIWQSTTGEGQLNKNCGRQSHYGMTQMTKAGDRANRVKENCVL